MTVNAVEVVVGNNSPQRFSIGTKAAVLKLARNAGQPP